MNIDELREAHAVWTGRQVRVAGVDARVRDAQRAGDVIAAALPGVLDELEAQRRRADDAEKTIRALVGAVSTEGEA